MDKVNVEVMGNSVYLDCPRCKTGSFFGLIDFSEIMESDNKDDWYLEIIMCPECDTEFLIDQVN